ncbi:hypothetical protein B6U66_04180 [Candidatus Bathyarchaeota archaeon ex4484_135]|nr:MAG: hypothetical protein B6U66_04180 [Candidatus Bathyarchaeota archaeon ex4484_135]
MVELGIEVRKGDSLFSVLMSMGHMFPSNCGGKGLCGRCRVRVLKGEDLLSPPSELERKILAERELKAGWRLACQAEALSNGLLLLEVPTLSYKLVVEGLERPVSLSPLIRSMVVEVPRPSLKDLTPDAERLLKVTGAVEIDFDTLRSLPILLRRRTGRFQVVLRKREVLNVRTEHGRLLGVAVDMGTTKLAAYLVDLSTGELLATASDVNPQIAFGEDIMSRVAFSMQKSEGVKMLQEALVEGVNKLITKACEEAGVKANNIYELVLVGNTMIHHSFLGISLNGLGVAPFVLATRNPVEIKARELGLLANRAAYVYLPPPIAGFVGSDALAASVASGLHETSEVGMLIDLGTNTEIILSDGDELWAASCASGPAFEGWKISCGSRAVEGAIDSVRVEPGTYEVAYSTIGGAKPIGICGSGLIDALAELYRAGVLDASGRMLEVPTPRCRRRDGVLEFVLAWSGETGTGRDVVLTQKDVRELQLAKAAVQAGAEVLMEKAGVRLGDLEVLYLAGAFGSSLNFLSARTIGLCPDVPFSKVRFLGNAAGAGARMMLKNVQLRREAEALARRVKFVELAVEKGFREKFLDALRFPPLRA